MQKPAVVNVSATAQLGSNYRSRERTVRDVVTGFYVGVLRKLVAAKTISTSDSVLVVCAGPLDEAVMRTVGFINFTLTNMDAVGEHQQDAERLTYDDASFDVVIVHAGLHHCYSPHRALLEMYRVARKAVVAFEARDSLVMRAAVRLGLTLKYETNAISADGKTGGAGNGSIPNFVYRWTERDVRNTIASFDPAREPQVSFFYDLRLPLQRLTGSRLKPFVQMIEPLSQLIAAVAPKQCNEFAFAVVKNGKVHPWIK